MSAFSLMYDPLPLNHCAQPSAGPFGAGSSLGSLNGSRMMSGLPLYSGARSFQNASVADVGSAAR